MSARSYTLDKRRQGNITVFNDDARITVRLHNTDIVVYDKLSKVTRLTSGGWRTVTTKTAINRFFSLMGLTHRVSQVKGEWYLDALEFRDNMSVGGLSNLDGLSNRVSIEAYRQRFTSGNI